MFIFTIVYYVSLLGNSVGLQRRSCPDKLNTSINYLFFSGESVGAKWHVHGQQGICFQSGPCGLLTNRVGIFYEIEHCGVVRCCP